MVLRWYRIFVQNCASQLTDTTLTLEYHPADDTIDQASKLIADNAFSALRTCLTKRQL